jgi:hypothetical protein
VTLLALIGLALALVAGTCAITLAVRRRRTPPELRGDWWTPFEREFRAYARQAARLSRGGDRGRRHHRGEPA